MHCESYQNEISRLAGRDPSAGLVEHVTSCHVCSAFLESCRELDRIWTETRPTTPAYAWDSIWRSSTQARPRPLVAQPKFKARLILYRVSAAVTGLAAAVAFWVVYSAKPSQAPVPMPALVLDAVSLDEGQTPLIHLASDTKDPVENLQPNDDSIAANLDNFDILNAFEAKAK